MKTKEEKLAFQMGYKEALKDTKKELKLLRERIEEWRKINKMEGNSRFHTGIKEGIRRTEMELKRTRDKLEEELKVVRENIKFIEGKWEEEIEEDELKDIVQEKLSKIENDRRNTNKPK